MGSFETRAINLFALALWAWILAGFVFCLYSWFLYLVGALGGVTLYELLALTLIVAPLFILFSVATFPKIKIDRDGVLLRYGFTSMFFPFDEVRIEVRRSVLRLGAGTGLVNWYAPLRRKGCMEVAEKMIGVYPAKVPRGVSSTFYLYLLPVPILFLVEQFLKRWGTVLNPIVWSLLWGIVTASSLMMFTHKAPVKMEIWKLDKAGSSILFGALIGIAIFLFRALTAG